MSIHTVYVLTHSHGNLTKHSDLKVQCYNLELILISKWGKLTSMNPSEKKPSKHDLIRVIWWAINCENYTSVVCVRKDFHIK